jgi:TonB-dependent starch-binding outer membrane protein SusC
MKKNHFLINCFQFCKLKQLLLPLQLTILLSIFITSSVLADNGNNSAAQKQKVTGTVYDATTKEPLIGVNVVIQGTTIGAITDANGRYSIDVPDINSVLILSYMGYVTQNVTVNNQSVIDIQLQPDVQKLNEVIVVGYGTTKKSDITGSVTSVNTKDIMKLAPTNILQGLKGQAAGVMVSAQDGSPDANSAVQIRGVGTVFGTTKPLYVIDGVVVGDNANFLSPSDVESVEILKDASATAIYGAAGANGIIMITTKHGSVGSTHLTFTADFGIQQLAKTLDVGNVDQYAKNIRQARVNDGTSVVNPIFSEQYDGKRKNIDWQKEMTRVALKQQYSLSAQGGTEKTQQYVSVSYLNHDGIVINSNARRLTARANVVTKVANFIEMGGDVNFVHNESRGNNAAIDNNTNLSSLRDWAFLCPTMDYIDPGTHKLVSPNVINANGTYGSPIQADLGSTYDGQLSNNIVAEQYEQNGVTKRNQTILSAYLNIKLLKGLTFKTVGSYNFSSENYNRFWGDKKRYEPDGITRIKLRNYKTDLNLDINNNNYNTLALESYLTYNWKSDIHDITLMAGNSVRREFGSWSNCSGVGFPGESIRDIRLTDDPARRTGSGALNLEVHNLSYFGRLQYSLMDRYILTGTIRRDGSSRFGPENTWGTFPSAAFAWRVSQESFLKDNPIVNNLKLRFGWGQTGNSGNQNSDLATIGLTSSKVYYNYYPQNGILGAGSSSRIAASGFTAVLADPKLKWETNEQINIGVDLGLVYGLNLTLDYFVRKTKDLLNYQQIRSSSGFTQVYTNLGSIENKGFEISLNYSRQINQDWHIGATVTASHVKNEIVSIGKDIYFQNMDESGDKSNMGAVGAVSGTHWDNHSIMREGYAVGSFYGYKVDGIYRQPSDVDDANNAAKALGHSNGYNNGNATVAGDYKFKDIAGNADGSPDGYLSEADMTILGDGFPKLNYGLNLNASYKNWDIMVYGYGAAGLKIYSYSAMTVSDMFPSDNGTTPNVLNDVAQNAWRPDNIDGQYARLTFLDKNYNMRGSDAWVKTGDYFKISNIQIGYTLGKNILKAFHLESVRISASIQNVCTISSYNKYGDPEAGQGNAVYTGLDTGRYPMPRIYCFGLNLQF